MGKGRHTEKVNEREKGILILLHKHRAAWFPPAWQNDLFSNFTHHPKCGEWEGRGKDRRIGERRASEGRGSRGFTACNCK